MNYKPYVVPEVRRVSMPKHSNNPVGDPTDMVFGSPYTRVYVRDGRYVALINGEIRSVMINGVYDS